jgi:hypothetical protein
MPDASSSAFGVPLHLRFDAVSIDPSTVCIPLEAFELGLHLKNPSGNADEAVVELMKSMSNLPVHSETINVSTLLPEYSFLDSTCSEDSLVCCESFDDNCVDDSVLDMLSPLRSTFSSPSLSVQSDDPSNFERRSAPKLLRSSGQPMQVLRRLHHLLHAGTATRSPHT